MKAALLVAALLLLSQASTADPHRKMYALGDFRFETGTVLPNATLAYATFGSLNADRSNAVLIPSWYGSDHHGYDFLIGAGRALDPARDFIVATEMFANAHSSSPSNTPAPFDGPRFPLVAIRDNVTAAHQLLTRELGIQHLRAVVGFSMGAEQAFQWAVSFPGFVDRVVAYCGTAKTYPHGVIRLESAISAMAADAEFRDGHYTQKPMKGITAWSDHWTAWTRSQEWFRRELFKPGARTVDEFLARQVTYWAAKDPNDLIAQARTWQRHNIGETPGFGGDVERALRAITVPVLYMPGQTDLYFPVADAEYEKAFLPNVRFAPIPSISGHLAGAGGNDADNAFLNQQIRDFLR